MNHASKHAEVVAQVIQQRRTFKVISNDPVAIDEQRMQQADTFVSNAIKTAGWAPFHYDRGANDLAEPWRVDLLRGQDCRAIASKFFDWFADVKPNNKLPSMLNACGSLILISWLPQFESDDPSGSLSNEKQKQVDEEHLAATSAYVQNLLLLLTAEGLGTYWSSGGQFRQPLMREKLNIQHNGRLLAAVFVDYLTDNSQENDSIERLAGKQRDRRDVSHRWFREVDMPCS